MAQRNSSVFSAGRILIGAGLVLLGSVATMAWMGERSGGEPSQPAPPAPGIAVEPPAPLPSVERPAVAPEPPAPAVARNEDLAVKVSFDRSLVARDDRDATAMIELEIPTRRDRTRRGAAIAIVIDRSGSMKGNKMDNAKRAAHGLVDRLVAGDTVSVVSFDAAARTHLANFEIGDDREAAHAAIDAIRVKGNTCMSCGLAEAYALLAQAPFGHGRRVVLLSDGEANRGDRTADTLGALAHGGLDESRVATATIGIGEGFDTDVMRAIAERGTGGYYFVHNSKGIRDVLAREADSLAGVVADNVQVRVEPLAGAAALDDGAGGYGRERVLEVGQLADGDTRRLIVPLQLFAGDLGEVLKVEASYIDGDGTRRALIARGTLLRSDDATAVDKSVDPGVVIEQTRQSTPAAIEQALDAYDEGDSDDAAVQLEAQASTLEAVAASSPQPAPELAREAAEVRAIAKRVRRHKKSSKAAVITRRLNDARNVEVKRGVPADDMYYDGPRGNTAARPASELE